MATKAKVALPVEKPEKPPAKSGRGGARANSGGPRPNCGGPQPNSGRKSKASMMGLLALLDKCWTPDDREACVVKLSALARQGDMDATKLLFNYAFGRPKEIKEHSGIDGGAIKHDVFLHRYDKQIDPE